MKLRYEHDMFLPVMADAIGVNDMLLRANSLRSIYAVREIIDCTAELIRSRRKKPFAMEVEADGTARACKTMQKIVQCATHNFEMIEACFPSHRMSPLYHLFRESIGDLRYRGSVVYPEMVPEINRVVDAVRAGARDPVLRKELDNINRSVRRAVQASESLLELLRERYSKIVAVRVDLSYGCEPFAPDRSPASRYGLQDIQRHRDELLAYLRNGPLAGDLAGYMWRIEYGLEKGYHLHVAVFFDGQRVRQDITLGAIIGENWRHEITGGDGRYFNCNRKKEAYKRAGLGMLARSDSEKWGNLGFALEYLAKADYYKRFQQEGAGKGRNFGTGGPYKSSRRPAYPI